jgi:hypothetical protein
MSYKVKSKGIKVFSCYTQILILISYTKTVSHKYPISLIKKQTSCLALWIIQNTNKNQLLSLFQSDLGKKHQLIMFNQTIMHGEPMIKTIRYTFGHICLTAISWAIKWTWWNVVLPSPQTAYYMLHHYHNWSLTFKLMSFITSILYLRNKDWIL